MFEYLLTRHRGLFATLFLLPLSVAYNSWFVCRNRIAFLLNSAPSKHNQRVTRIIQQIKQWQQEGAKQKLCTNRSGWLTMSELVPRYKQQRKNIEVNLRNVLEVNTTTQTVRVEPLVNMGQITATLIPLGWTLPVVPELDDLTVGGLIMGFGIESSSHKYGLFQHICEAFEIVTAEGKLVRCTREENAELFYLIPWSYGTLGILVAAELKIIPAKKYVRVKYQPLYSLHEIVTRFEEASRNVEENDFVECLQYSKDKAVLMTGNFADKAGTDGTVNAIGHWYKPWFYTHAEKFLVQGEDVEYIPMRHYYHRHTRSLFWEMADIIPFGNTLLFRWLLGWALPPRISLLKYFETETIGRLREKYNVVQDMLMPVKKLKESLEYFDANYNLYPLWLSPMRIYSNPKNIGFIHPHTKNEETDDLFVDIGAYGRPRINSFDGTQALHQLEQFVLNHNGYQALYARTSLSAEDLRKMFDHTDYDRIRQQLPYCVQAFGDVYEKVSGRVSPSQLRKPST